MAAPCVLNVFIPHHFLNDCFLRYLIGYYEITETDICINCVIAYKCSKTSKEIDHYVKQWPKSIELSTSDTKIKCLGILYDVASKASINKRIEDSFSSDVHLILCVDGGGYDVYAERAKVKLQEYSNFCQIIIYDGYDLMKSELLLRLQKANSDTESENKSFIYFLLETAESSLNLGEQKFDNELECIGVTKCLATNSYAKNANSKIYRLFSAAYRTLCALLYFAFVIIGDIFQVFFDRFPCCITKLILLTAIGKQFHQRCHQTSIFFEEFRSRKNLSLNCHNMIWTVLFDILCGTIITYYLWYYNLPQTMLNVAMENTNEVVNALQRLIHWLMGVPAGLKLNKPLNSALGHFFLYHIYLWQTYMTIVKPVFASVLELSTFVGILGITFFFSLINDLISLATIHIYCFYGYAARLYDYQMSSLVALWRLFRGKKFNPLRQRVDSYTYDLQQLGVGTPLFTILIFLFPTTMVYYSVFTSLRVAVLVIQGFISRLINLLNILPLYTLVLRTFDSNKTKGDVYFTVVNKNRALVLMMQAVQIPLRKTLEETMPELHHYEKKLSWKKFLSSLVWGKIIYPL